MVGIGGPVEDDFFNGNALGWTSTVVAGCVSASRLNFVLVVSNVVHAPLELASAQRVH